MNDTSSVSALYHCSYICICCWMSYCTTYEYECMYVCSELYKVVVVVVGILKEPSTHSLTQSLADDGDGGTCACYIQTFIFS